MYAQTESIETQEIQKNAQLSIVQIGDPILRQTARLLTREEILSAEIQQLIKNMKETMSKVGVGLAAPQIGYPLQIIVIEDSEEYLATVPKELLKIRERKAIPFHVIINPKITIDTSEYVEFFEGCLSVPDCIGVVPRARRVRVECINEKAEPINIEASGWYARILQHECEHLLGEIFIDHAYTKSLSTFANYEKYWQKKPHQRDL